MESVLGRYRNLTILVGVLFLQVLGLAVQVKRSTDAQHTRLIRIWAVDAITPFERILVRTQIGAHNLWNGYFFLRGVRAENRELKEQIEKMRLDQVRLNEDAAQAHRLQSLLAFKEQFIAKTVAAQVIGSSASDLSRSVYIDKGSDDGIAADMPVITAGGVVGKVLRVYPSTSLVLMINDQSSGVGVLLEKSRLQGVLRGTADGELILERVMSDEQVVPGETVVSSGGDQIFPKGLPVGVVSKVTPGKELFLNIKLKPSADLGKLEEVLVVTERQEHAPVAESGVRVRAADILAQRLPSVPEKPPVVAGAAPQRSTPSQSPSVSGAPKPAPDSTIKPLPGAATKSSQAPAASTLAGGSAAKTGAVHSINVANRAADGEGLKKAVQMQAPGNSANGEAVSIGTDPNKAGLASKTNPANPSVRTAPVAAKPTTQSTPRPAATEDTPH